MKIFCNINETENMICGDSNENIMVNVHSTAIFSLLHAFILY